MNNKSTEMDRASEPEVIIREITMSASEPAAPYDEYTLNVKWAARAVCPVQCECSNQSMINSFSNCS